MTHDLDGAAGRRQPPVGGAEQRDDGRAERRRQVPDSGVATHYDVELAEERGQEIRPVASHQIGHVDLLHHGARQRLVIGRAHQHGHHVLAASEAAELHDALDGPDLRGPERRAEMHADPRPGRGADLAEQGAHGLSRLAVGRRRCQRRHGVGRSHAERLEQHQVLVDLVSPRRRHRHAIREQPVAAPGGKSDAPLGPPVPGRRGGLEGVRQQHRDVGCERSDGVGGPQSPAPCPRIRDEDVGQVLIDEESRPRPGQDELGLASRLAERANRGHGHHRVAQPVGQANDQRLGHARSKAVRHAA